VVGIGACFGFSEAEAEPEPAAVRLHERLEELNRVRKRQLEVRAELGSIEGMAQGSSPAPRVAPNEAAEGTVGEPGAAEGGEARSFDSSLIRNGTQKLLEAVRRRVQHGPSATRGERLEELASIEQGLTPPEASSQLDALGRLYDFIGRDLHLGSSVRLEETPVELEDGARRVHAYVLGLGLVLEAFVSEDETLVGLRTDATKPYDTSVTPAVREALVAAVRVLRREAEPEMVTLPLGALRAGPNEEGRK
jgi:hypothetical protein